MKSKFYPPTKFASTYLHFIKSFILIPSIFLSISSFIKSCHRCGNSRNTSTLPIPFSFVLDTSQARGFNSIALQLVKIKTIEKVFDPKKEIWVNAWKLDSLKNTSNVFNINLNRMPGDDSVHLEFPNIAQKFMIKKSYKLESSSDEGCSNIQSELLIYINNIKINMHSEKSDSTIFTVKNNKITAFKK